MNILYISNLTGNLYAGPNHSVPAQIRSQSKIDNVMWYNLNYIRRDEWTVDGLDCKNFFDYPTGRLHDLPNPFCNPDLVVVEEFYCFPFSKIISDIWKKSIPYVIIPRSELTEQAQRKKHLKKAVANFLYFNKLAQRALAIQYLSQQEFNDSRNKWNQNSLIIPNGTSIKNVVKKQFSHNQIKAVYIGRYERYQKGLDILIDAIFRLRDKLRESNFQLDMYGVDQENAVTAMKKLIDAYSINDLIHINGAVYGEQKESILINSDVFIMTSRFEGMPMGMIEALSLGLPCIATIGTNLTDEIKKYDAGWIAENNLESVIKTIEVMLDEAGDLCLKGHNARVLSSKFSWDSISKKSHEEYKKIIEGTK